MRIIGIDPGLRHCGWGVIEISGARLTHRAHGVIHPPTTGPLSRRLGALYDGLAAVLALHAPEDAAMEEAFMAKNAASALKLGHARGAIMTALNQYRLGVAEYAARTVKKAVVGAGGAEKDQVALMINMLLPGCGAKDDAADALAVAICHAHHAPALVVKRAS